MISTVLLTLTLFLFYWGYTSERRRTLAYLLMFVPMGLGTLNMGPVNLVMPAICVFFYLDAIGDLRHAFTKRFILTMLGGLLVYFVVVGPWYVTVCLREEYRENLLFFTNITRYFGEFAHARPFYYYVGTTPGYFLPWVLFLPPLAYVCYTDVPGDERQRLRESITGVMSFFRAVFGLIVSFARTADGKKLLFPLMWAGSLFLFFSFSKTKRSEYMLPIFPALALLVGYFLDRAFRQAKESAFWRKSIAWPVYVVLAAFALAAIALPLVAAVLASEWIALVLPLSAILLVGSGFTYWLLRKRPGVPVVVALSCVIAASVAYAAGPIVVKGNEDESSRHFCSVVREKTEGEERIKMFKCYHPMYPYYTRKLADTTVDPAVLEAWLRSEERVYIIMKERHYLQLKDTFPVPLHRAHREWIDHRYMVLVSNRPDG